MLALALSTVLAAGVPWGDGRSQAEDLTVSLVTFSPGDDLDEWFGHSALVVEDRRLHQARLYNYGEYKLDDTVILHYALGRLDFQVGERSVAGTYARYRAANRTIHVEELALSPEQAQQAAAFLAHNALPENRTYLYDHYTDNCATRPRDIIDRFSGGKLKAQTKPGRMTLREHTRRMTAVGPVMAVVIDFLEDATVDLPITTWQEAFLPQELADQVRAAGLVRSEHDEFVAARAPVRSTPPNFAPALLLLGLVGAASALALVRKPRWLALHAAVVSVVLGLPGTVSFLMWTVTDHVVTHRNENLFLANPLTLFALIPAALAALSAHPVEKTPRLARIWTALLVVGAVGVLLHLVPVLHQDIWWWTALALPLVAGEAAAFTLARRAC